MSDKMKERNSFNKKLLLFFGGVFFDRKKDFNREQKEIYAEQTEESKEGYGSFLALSLPMLSVFSQIPKFQEYLYELEESKKYFEGAWEDAFEIMKACSKEEPPKIYFQKKINIIRSVSYEHNRTIRQ